MKAGSSGQTGLRQGGFGFRSIIHLLFLCLILAMTVLPASADGPYDIYWKAQLGTAGTDTAYGMAGDSAGNVYVVGKTSGNLDGKPNNGGTSDAFIVKYDSGGALLCSALLGTAGADAAYGVAVDTATGDVYVVGETSGALGTQIGGIDMFLAKYDSTCVLQGTVTQDGTSATDIAWAVAVNSTGDVFVTGETSGNFSGTGNGGKDVFIAKYNSSLVNQLKVQAGTTADDVAYAIAIDGSGDPHVVGETSGDLDGAGTQTYSALKDMFWAKYASSTFTVMKQLGTTAADVANGIATDSLDNVYISGFSAGDIDGAGAGSNAGGKDIVVAKYNSAGAQQWLKQFGTVNDDTAESIATDQASGEVFIVGATAGNLDGYTLSGTSDAFITKYDTGGTKLWTKQVGTAGADSSWSVVYDIGYLYIAGETSGDFDGTNAGGIDLIVAQLSPDSTAPNTTIGATKPVNPTNATSATFSFSCSDWDPVSAVYNIACVNGTFQCKLDLAGSYALCTSPVTYTGPLSAGSHTFYVKAIDASGNADGTPASYTWTVDLTAPDTTITAKPTHPSNDNTPSFTFSTVAAESGVTYAYRMDGGAYSAYSSSTTYTSAALLDGNHTFNVKARDAAGNEDLTPAAYTWTLDATAPDTGIVTGCPTGPTNSTTATFTFSKTESGTFECKMSPATTFTACVSGVSYTGLTAGAKTFNVRAKDTAGNVDASPAICSWTVDVTAPNTTIAIKPATPSNDNTPTFTFTSSEASSTFRCDLDGLGYASCNSGSITYDLSAAPDGSHTFSVYATDPATNVDGTPATYTWTIDTEVPVTSLLTNPAAVTKSTSAAFTFTSTETVSTTTVSYQCKKDAEVSYTACTSPKNYTGLTAGSHTFYVQAKDAAGNIDLTPATYTWTVDTVAPVTTILTNPVNPTKLLTADFTFSAGGETVTFKCKKDTEAYADCGVGVISGAKSYAALTAGSHTFSVYAIDAAGNSGLPKSWTWVVDTSAPETTITGKPTANSSDLSPTFTFTSSEAGSTFVCDMDNAAVWNPCTSGTAWTPDLAEGAHIFKVKARDIAGNIDATPATYSWTVTTALPVTTITAKPALNAKSASASFSFTARTGATFQCSLDGAVFAACTSPKAYSALAQGSHTFSVQATDAIGTENPPASYTWTVDTVVPDTTILTKPVNPTKLTTATFTFTKNEAVSTTAVTYQCKKDTETSYAACTSPKSYTGLTAGSHTFYVRAKDAAGNIDATPATYSWTVDLTAPDTSITAKPANPSNDSTPTFSFSSVDTAATFQCSLDGAAFGACTSPKTYGTTLTDGSHTFKVRAKDAAGNIDATPATYTWTIDTVVPDTTIGTKPPLTTTSTSASFTFSSADATATFQCKHDVGATPGTWAVCTSPKNYTALALGSHTFSVRAKDTAGNIDATPDTYTWTVQ